MADPQKLETVLLARRGERDHWTQVYEWSAGHVERAGNEVAPFVRVPESDVELVPVFLTRGQLGITADALAMLVSLNVGGNKRSERRRGLADAAEDVLRAALADTGGDEDE